MLKNLSIKNIVLIDEADIDFDDGLCVLTGETGSGKSILLDALSLAIGTRSSSRLLRNGEKQGIVTASFDISKNQNCKFLLSEIGIECENELILRRILTQDGKSKSFINDITVSQNFLNLIGKELVEIHGQHDQNNLLNSTFHMGILDQFGNLTEQKKIVSDIYKKMSEINDKLVKLKDEKISRDNEIDYLEHIVGELKRLNVSNGEEEELNSKRIIMMNKEKVIGVINNAKELLDGQNSVIKLIGNTQNIFSRNMQLGENLIENNKNVFESIVDYLEKSLIEFNEAMDIIYNIQNSLDFDEYSLNDVEERLFAIRSLSRKLNISSDDFENYKSELEKKLNNLKNANIEIGNLEMEYEQLKNEYLTESKKLREQRKIAAKKLEDDLLIELTPLKMENTIFRVDFTELTEKAWNKNGIDGIKFVVSINPGTEPDDLSKVASGGELSRFMLALKVVLSKIKSASTLIFDEIDTGVSGAVADAIGDRLRKLGENFQVFVVTHLAQVAAKGKNHYKISKEVRNEKTYTIIKKLDYDSKLKEISNMISGKIAIDEALDLARKLIKN